MKSVTGLLLIALVLQGCETINKSRTIVIDKKNGKAAPARAIFVDAKQRAVTFVPTETNTFFKNDRGEVEVATKTWLRVCGEPSPDALTAIATSGQGSLSVKDQVDLSAAFSRSEAAASIGLRTQSITIMRDVLHRICEDYQSGSLTPAGVETLTRRYQSSMVAILAIEQLTGVVRAPAVVLGGAASTGGAESVAAIYNAQVKAQSAADTAKTKAEAAKKDSEAAKGELEALNATSDSEKDQAHIDAAKKKVDDAAAMTAAAEADLADKNAKAKNAQHALDAVGPGDGSASSEAASNAPDPLPGPQSETIAEAVRGIVSDTLELGFLREGCATLMTAAIEGRSAILPLTTDTKLRTFADACQSYFEATVDSLATANAAKQAAADLTLRISDRISVLPHTAEGNKLAAELMSKLALIAEARRPEAAAARAARATAAAQPAVK